MLCLSFKFDSEFHVCGERNFEVMTVTVSLGETFQIAVLAAAMIQFNSLL